MLRAIATLLIATISLGAAAQAPSNPPIHVRGVVEKIDGQMLTVKSRTGEKIAIKLADNFTVMGIVKASIAEITSGKYVGTTTLGERNGALVAVEVHIFPESMRGVGEGYHDWDLRANSKMTNANVANITKMGRDRLITVQYKGAEKKVLVPPTASIVAFSPTEPSALKAGAHVFLVAQRQPDGNLMAAWVNVGLKGQVPPM
jgi:hypothetical protein